MHENRKNILKEFNTAAAKAVADHPVALRHFVATTEDEVVFISKEIENNGFNSHYFDDIREYFAEKWKADSDITASCRSFENDTINDIHAIGIKVGKLEYADMQFWWDFAHEVGHLVVPGGTEGVSLAKEECIAETYAALYHAQKYGANSDFIEIANLERARNVACGWRDAVSYYHPKALDAVAVLSMQCDLSRLTPQETVAITRQITEEFSFSTRTRHRIQLAARKLWKNEANMTEAALEGFRDAEKNPDVARFYQDVLTHRFGRVKIEKKSKPSPMMTV